MHIKESGVRRVSISIELSQAPWMHVTIFGRKAPLDSLQIHLISVSWQLSSVDWSMHCDMHFGRDPERVSWAEAMEAIIEMTARAVAKCEEVNIFAALCS